jgi:hypothetical protein
MRVICAAAMIAMLTGPVYAQEKRLPAYGEEAKDKTAVEKETDKAAQRAYERSLGNIPEKGPTDPWGQVRNIDGPKTTAKTPAVKKPPAKTGSTTN